jgi:hypothetical protein
MSKHFLKQLGFFVLILAISGAILLVLNKFSSKNPADINQIREPSRETSQVSEIKSLLIGNREINVILVQTPEERQMGLSGRTNLPANTGMLFVFETPGTYGFWMKDMLFSIDMVWISADKRIIHIEKSVSPDTFPKAFSPKDPALYVLEVKAGFSDKNNIKVGDTIKFLK